MWIGRVFVAAVVATVLLLLMRVAPFRAESYFFYAALIVALVACVALIVPLPLVGLWSRPVAAGVGLVAAAVAALCLTWPGRTHRARGGDQLLDRIMPVWDEAEEHRLEIAAPPDAVWRAMWELRPSDVPVAGILMRLRMAAAGHFAPPAPLPGSPLLS